jgi:hypothetical protein
MTGFDTSITLRTLSELVDELHDELAERESKTSQLIAAHVHDDAPDVYVAALGARRDARVQREIIDDLLDRAQHRALTLSIDAERNVAVASLLSGYRRGELSMSFPNPGERREYSVFARGMLRYTVRASDVERGWLVVHGDHVVTRYTLTRAQSGTLAALPDVDAATLAAAGRESELEQYADAATMLTLIVGLVNTGRYSVSHVEDDLWHLHRVYDDRLRHSLDVEQRHLTSYADNGAITTHALSAAQCASFVASLSEPDRVPADCDALLDRLHAAVTADESDELMRTLVRHVERGELTVVHVSDTDYSYAYELYRLDSATPVLQLDTRASVIYQRVEDASCARSFALTHEQSEALALAAFSRAEWLGTHS